MVNCCGQRKEETRTVTLRYLRKELLYHIKNNAYKEWDVMNDGDGDEHAKHVAVEICEPGNIDRVNDLLSLIHADVIEMLHPYTKKELVDEVVEVKIEEPESYDVVLTVPVTMSRTTVLHLSKLIHEYMVCRIIGDWLGTPNAQAASVWLGKAEDAKTRINEVKNYRTRPQTRKISVL